MTRFTTRVYVKYLPRDVKCVHVCILWGSLLRFNLAFVLRKSYITHNRNARKGVPTTQVVYCVAYIMYAVNPVHHTCMHIWVHHIISH